MMGVFLQGKKEGMGKIGHFFLLVVERDEIAFCNDTMIEMAAASLQMCFLKNKV